jgi:Rad3-related DNA helicase
LILNQLLEEYQESGNKKEILNRFLNKLWGSKYKYKKYKKYYKYKVNSGLLNNRQDLIDLFNKYNQIEYTVCKSFYSNSKINSVDYIRIHINNMYGYLFDKDVYYTNKHYNLLLTPKKEYFKVVDALKNGGNVEYEKVKFKIDKAFQEAETIKNQSIGKKHDMQFNQYKELINSYIQRIFDNYISIEEYEKKHGWELNVKIDGWHEDNYVIKYFCKSLTGYMRNYIRNLQPREIKKKNCIICGVEIFGSNRKKYCDDCWLIRERELWKNNKRKHRNVQV